MLEPRGPILDADNHFYGARLLRGSSNWTVCEGTHIAGSGTPGLACKGGVLCGPLDG